MGQTLRVIHAQLWIILTVGFDEGETRTLSCTGSYMGGGSATCSGGTVTKDWNCLLISSLTNVQQVQSLLDEYASDCFEPAGDALYNGMKIGYCAAYTEVGTAGYEADGLLPSDELYDANPMLECAKRCNALALASPTDYGTGFYTQVADTKTSDIFHGRNGRTDVKCSCAKDDCPDSSDSTRWWLPFRRVANFDKCVAGLLCKENEYVSSNTCTACPAGKVNTARG